MLSIQTTIHQYLETVGLARSENTFRTYKNGMNAFINMLLANAIDVDKSLVDIITVEHFSSFIQSLKGYAPATEQLYLTSVLGFYEYLVAENLSSINLQTLRSLIRKRARKPGQRLPQFPKSAIDIVLEKAMELNTSATEDEKELLRNYRDRAFLLTLADTGLRVHEACNLRRGDIDWFEARAMIIGKGNQQSVIRFSARCISAMQSYLNKRAQLDGNVGIPLGSLPIFARHDKGAGKKIKPISTVTGRNIVTERVRQFLGETAVGSITPHSFRHYFVTRVLQASGNLKLAQSLARHKNIAVTQRYAHINDDELDQGFHEIFD
ncbi:MAG: hypothetical protein CL609_19310 [Anaerolineaceae bacterium]|nr:hypothetical protein [Anaerolineaceae bacterium]